MSVLPDLLAFDLDIVFCGTAAGTVSAARQAYYAGPGNAFWPTLFDVGLTPRRVMPQEFREILGWRMGFTDMAQNTFGSDDSLTKSDFDAPRVRGLIATFRPRIIAFTSKRAASEFLGVAVGYGALGRRVDATQICVLPSPSGAARRFWDLTPWRELARLRAVCR